MAFVSIDWTPTDERLRRFGTASVFVFGALGAWIAWRHRAVGVSLAPATAMALGATLWALAALCALARWAAPGWLRPLYVGLMVASFPIGFVMSRVVVGIVFFVVVTPIALVFRLMGRDALGRTFDRSAATYWTRRVPVVDPARYFRQF